MMNKFEKAIKALQEEGKKKDPSRIFEKELRKYISDIRLVNKLYDYGTGNSITFAEKNGIIRTLKRTKIGDNVSFKAIIERSRNLPEMIKRIIWVEPEEETK